MRYLLRALVNAAGSTALWGIVMLIPGFNIIGLIIVMLPLWMLHDMGIHGLGEPNNGFFVPTTRGFVVGAAIIFAVCLLLALLTQRKSPAK